MSSLREVIEDYLANHGYQQAPSDPAYWTVRRGDDFYTDKLLPMVVDCLEAEDGL